MKDQLREEPLTTAPRLERSLADLRSLLLPEGDYVVFGSAALVIAGILDDVGDLDVLCRGPAWEAVLELGPLVELTEHGVSVVSLQDGALTFGTTWAIGTIDVDEVIDSAIPYRGLPIARVEDVLAYKRSSSRTKDQAHVAAYQRVHGRSVG